MNFYTVLVFFVISCLAFSLKGQTFLIQSNTDSSPVEFAFISIHSLDQSGKEIHYLSDASGMAKIAGQLNSNAKYELLIAHIGFEPFIDTVTISSGPDHTFTFILSPKQELLQEVVITGQYSPNNPEKSVHKIRIIDANRIEAQAAQNLRDLLSNEMNIQISQDNILGSGMSMQGISGENVKILIDGVPVIGRQNGNIDLTQINLNNIQRVEIIEGPMSVNYGTNALAGTINLISKKKINEGIESRISTYYETTGNYNVNGFIGYSKNKHSLLASGGRNFFDGWHDGEKINFDFGPQPADSSRFQAWKPKTQYFADLTYSYTFDGGSIQYKSIYFNEKIINRGLPRSPYQESAFDDYYFTNRFDNALFLNTALTRDRQLNFLVSFNQYKRIKNTYFNDLTTLNKTLSENSSDQDTSNFALINSRATYNTSKLRTKINYEFGYDVNLETAKGIRIQDEKHNIGDFALFATAEYVPFKSKDLIIRPGFRYAYNTAYRAPLIPSLNMKFRLDKLTFRASYARGFRAPSLKELYFYFVDINHNIRGNENLKAEHANNFNLSTNYSRIKGNNQYKIELSGFYNHIDDLISLALAGNSEYTYINIGNYQTIGVQLSSELTKQNWKISLGANITGRSSAIAGSFDNETFTYAPEFRGNVIYTLERLNLNAALFYKFTGQVPGFILDENNTVRQNNIGAYHTADISLTRGFYKKRMTLSVGAKNLLNVKNVNAFSTGIHNAGDSSIPVSTGRSFFVRLDIQLKGKE